MEVKIGIQSIPRELVLETKASADEVTHRDIDLSLRAPAKSDSGPAKKADTDAILPPGATAAVHSGTLQVGSTDQPAAK